TRVLNSTQPMPAEAPATSKRGRARRRMARRNDSFIPPWWAFVLMILGVGAISALVVLGVYMLGGDTPPESDPIVMIVTSEPPTSTAPAAPSAFPSSTPAFVEGVSIPVPEFVLEGPTLPPVILTATPDVISIGRTVQVINVGETGLNVRSNAGINNDIVFAAAENAFLEIVGGPESATEDSFTWWRVRDPFSQQEGWAVDLYMDVQAEQ
ncbi:MAG: SH3 domain-containing protein, partial [Chloroflexota bacterium]